MTAKLTLRNKIKARSGVTDISKALSRIRKIDTVALTMSGYSMPHDKAKKAIALQNDFGIFPILYPPNLCSSDHTQMWRFFACWTVDTINQFGVYVSWLIAPRWIILRKENSDGVIFCSQEVAN